MTPPAIMEEPTKPKRRYSEREVIARRCRKCGTRGRVYGRDRSADGTPQRTRYVFCPNRDCGETWTQTPDD